MSEIVDNEDDSMEGGGSVNVLRRLLQSLHSNEAAMEDLRNQLSKVSQRKIPAKKRSDKCVHCGAIVELDKLKEFVTCKGCEELACFNQKCSEFIYGLDVWECARCKKNRVIQQRAGEWLLRQLDQMKENDTAISLKADKTLNVEDTQSLAAYVSRNQRDKVRQFIEELLAKMLDGPLDDVSVGQLSNDESCLPIIGPVPASTTHRELKKVVQGIIEEIMNLPQTLDFSQVPGRPEEPLPVFDPKKYEQLLATAVLNKMTDFYQNDKNSLYNSSGVHSDVELDNNHNQLNGKAVIDLMVQRDEAPTIERLNSKAADDETHLSDYVQSHFVPLPDLSASDSANDDVEVRSVNSSNGTDGTWEDNWLFKKRKLKTENQSIAMLVPSPTEEIKALIGDTNADETSDMSENSDDESDGKTFKTTLVIDPKQQPVTTEVKIMSDRDSLKSMQSLISMDTSNSNIITEAKNNLLLVNDAVFKTPTAPEPIQKISFMLSGPVTSGESTLSELTVQVDKPTSEEEEFDSMVSPTQVREHKKSIDEDFEKLVMDDNNNNPMDVSGLDLFMSPERVAPVLSSSPSTPAPVSSQSPAKNDLLDDWVLVPDADDATQMKSVDHSFSIETNTSLQCHASEAATAIHKSDTFDSSTELAELERDPSSPIESPKHGRYSSPLFQDLLSAKPIEPVKISKLISVDESLKVTTVIESETSSITTVESDSVVTLRTSTSASTEGDSFVTVRTSTPTIPADESINVLLHAASLVSKSQKTSEIEKLTTNKTKNAPSEAAIDEQLLKLLSVPEKRPSVHDPEQVLMRNVVPGSIAEREHIKWLHAAPIANNPYSSEALQRRLSESDQKHKGLDISNNKLVDAIAEETKSSNEAEKEENEEVFQPKKVDLRKYKRDYYINESSEADKRLSSGSATSKSASIEIEDEPSDNIVPVSIVEKGFRSRTLHSGDIDSVGGSIVSDQDGSEAHGNFLSPPKSAKSNDDSLTYSEDSDTTRIYNLNTRETKIVLPAGEDQVDSPIESPVKIGQQFFRGSPKKVTEIRRMDDEVRTVIRTSSRNGDDGSEHHVVQEAYEEKQVIEPEVIDNLPSVKKLAEIYTKETPKSPVEIEPYKPKAFLASSSSDEGLEPIVMHQKVAKSSSDSFAPNYNNAYHPAMPIASITARSIPAQVRADLKKSVSYDEESIVRQGEREGSPDIQPGVTRNSIAFFENLKK